MRYALISDIHANLPALEKVLEAIGERGIDQTVCLGDVVGYNAHPNECSDLVRALDIPTICGNHDAVACGLEEPFGFNPVAHAAALWTRNALSPENLSWLRGLPDTRVFEHFAAVHGSPFDRDFYMFNWEDVLPNMDYLDQVGRSICFFGHTHSPGIFAGDGVYSLEEDGTFVFEQGKSYFVNPGSVGQPRDGDRRAAFGIYDTDRNMYELVRIEYDIDRAAARILENGLPPFLAERLSLGR